MHSTRNKAAGNDFFIGSLTLICIAIDPNNSIAKPIAEGLSSSINQIDTINKTDNATLRKPIM